MISSPVLVSNQALVLDVYTLFAIYSGVIAPVVMSRCIGMIRWSVLRLVRGCAGLALSLSLLACVSAPVPAPAPALQAAHRLEQRAAQAFAKGDAAGALADYQTAAQVYASLALTEPQLQALLNVARVQADLGATDATQARLAVQTVERVLAHIAANPGLSPGLQVLAHGRAAALRLKGDPVLAQGHLQQALALCNVTCPQAAALHVLQARLYWQQGQAADAVAVATLALQAAVRAPNPAEQANARRIRALAGLAQHPLAAADDVHIALRLDQSLGLAYRVQDDLRLLVTAYRALGDEPQARAYQALLDEALAAQPTK